MNVWLLILNVKYLLSLCKTNNSLKLRNVCEGSALPELHSFSFHGAVYTRQANLTIHDRLKSQKSYIFSYVFVNSSANFTDL